MSSTSSTSDVSGRRPETVAVARVLRPHGLRGEVVVEVLSDVPGRLEAGSELWLAGPSDGADGAGPPRRVRVAAARSLGRRRAVRLEGMADRASVEALRGAWLEVEMERVPPAPPGSYYPHELVGCRCRDRRLGELGVAQALIADGGGLLLRVVGPRGDLLVPFVETFVESVDRESRTIELALPEGLVEECGSRS
jgi:16S rRNA processing protein RimM